MTWEIHCTLGDTLGDFDAISVDLVQAQNRIMGVHYK